ncbi:MAG: hypothetical protein QNK37_26985 [Acidobacteriota bacterium]|nr:hypothetical protein [Acidobacteriota bacterium]
MEEGNNDFSHDSGFKNLVLDFPRETIDWLLPGVEKVYGKIVSLSFPLQETKKQKLTDKGRRNDAAIYIEFENGKALVPLMEHKGDKYSFSIYKMAHYALDLAEHFEGVPILPIVVFTDQEEWRNDVQREISLGAFGARWLYFTFARVKLSEIPARLVAGSKNPVKHILSPLMRYDKEDRLVVAADAYVNLSRLTDPIRFRKYTDYIDKCANIDEEERETLESLINEEEEVVMMKQYWLEKGEKRGEERGIRIGEERGEERGIKIGEERGQEKGKKEGLLEAARGMLAEGVELKVILRITGLSKEEIEPETPTED